MELGSAESGSLRMGKPKRAEVLSSSCHTRSSVRSHQMRTCSGHCPTPFCSAGRTGLLGDRLGGHTRTGSFSAPCTNRTAVDKCFHLAGLWLPSLTLVRVHTSRYYCVSKMLSPLPGGGQEIIIAWHIFLYQCRPRTNMAPPCGYDGIVCTCVITTIMIVYQQQVVNVESLSFSCLYLHLGPGLELQRMGA